MPISTLNGVRLRWDKTGDRGAPLVLVHGSWVDHHAWDPVMLPLSELFQVVTYDRRGHGDSERLDGQGRIDEDADDLAALVRSLDLGPAHIVGSSFGGSIVLNAASRHRDVFASLAVHEPPIFTLLAPNHPALFAIRRRMSEIVETLRRGDETAAARQFVETIAFGPGWWTQLAPQLRSAFVSNASTFMDEVNDPLAMEVDPTRLAHFGRPVLLSKGAQSPPFFSRVVDTLAGMFPGVARHTFAGAGHVPQVTHPTEFVRALANFARHANR